MLAVQDRRKEHAILQTLGYHPFLIGRLIVSEGAVVGAISGLIGTVAAAGVIHVTRLTISVDGLSIPIETDWIRFSLGLGISGSRWTAVRTTRMPAVGRT